MKFRLLLPFLVITLGLTWGLVGLLILFPEQIAAVFGELSAKTPLFMLAVYAPAIAAFTLVIHYGEMQGLLRYLSRLPLWKVHWGWYAYLLVDIDVFYQSHKGYFVRDLPSGCARGEPCSLRPELQVEHTGAIAYYVFDPRWSMRATFSPPGR